MNVDIDLEKIGLKWIINFQYNVGDCLFDAITYSLKYLVKFKMIQKVTFEGIFKPWHT
jgi:hypothetical protein